MFIWSPLHGTHFHIVTYRVIYATPHPNTYTCLPTFYLEYVLNHLNVSDAKQGYMNLGDNRGSSRRMWG